MSQWQALQSKYDTLEMREKWLILGVILFCLIYLTAWFVITPISDEISKNKAQIAQIEGQQKSLKGQIESLQIALQTDYKAKIQAQIDAQQTDIDALDSQLQAVTDGYVAAQNMPVALSDLLAQQSGLQWVDFKVKGVEPVTVNVDVENQPFVFYKHHMELVIEGDYFAVETYLKRLENSKNPLLITGFKYEVETYPRALVSLSLATVSSNESFIAL